MRKNSFILSGLVILILSTLLSSCGMFSGGDVEDEGDTTFSPLAEEQVLRLNLYTEPPVLDPRRANDITSSVVLKMLFEGLTRIDRDNKPAPALAKDIEISEDMTMYRFTLRDCYWSNGDPVTAYDFESSWKEILSPAFHSPYAYQLYLLKNAALAKSGELPLEDVGVEALDEKTLLVTLENPTPYFLELTAYHTFYPVHRKSVERNPEWSKEVSEDFVTCGPFRLESWKHHNELVVVPSDNYWDRKNVKLDKIKMVMISDESTELSMFENGELDWAGRPISRLPADAIPSLRDSGILKEQPIAGVEWYKFNTARFPFNNLKIRQAFSYAINRKDLIEKLMPDNHRAATGLIPQPLSLQEAPYFQDGDIEEARRLFEEALDEMNITRKDLPSITLSFNNNEAHAVLAQAIQQQWNAAFGIQVELEVAEWKVHINNMRNHDYQIGRLGWVADFRDPINFLDPFKYRNDPDTGGNNDTQWQSEEYISLLEASASEGDVMRRQEILRKAENLIVSEMPMAPIYFMTDNYVTHPRLRGVYLSGLGDIDFKWAHFISEK